MRKNMKRIVLALLAASIGLAQTGIPMAGNEAVRTVTATPYSVLNLDGYVVCNYAGATVLNLPSATGSGHVYYFQNLSGYSCTLTPNGGDTIDGKSVWAMSKNSGPAHLNSLTIIDFASATWHVLTMPLTFDNFGAGCAGSGDILLTASPQSVCTSGAEVISPWAAAADEGVVGQLEFYSSGTTAGQVTVTISLANAAQGSPVCILDMDIPNYSGYFVRPFVCEAYIPSPTPGQAYVADVWAYTSLTGVSVKHLDSTGAKPSSYINTILNVSY
jgi:hypothetical protein